MFLDKDPGLIEAATHPVLIGRSITGRTTTNGGGALLPRLDPGRHMDHSPDPPVPIDSREQAWQRLLSRAAPQDELPSLIETIFSDRETAKMVDRLRGSEAQAFIDVIDGVRHCALYSEEWVDLLLLQPPAICWLGVGRLQSRLTYPGEVREISI